MTNFKYDVDHDGIALVTWDMPGRSMNVLNADVLAELEALLDQDDRRCRRQGRGRHLRQGYHSPAAPTSRCCRNSTASSRRCANPRAMKLQPWRSSKRAARRRCFTGRSKPAASRGRVRSTALRPAAGLNSLSRVTTGSPAMMRARASACRKSRSACSRAPAARQRIARILPPADALQYLLKGDQLRTDRAQKMKLIDAVVPAADMVKTAKDWIKAGGSAKKPWDAEGFRLPGGAVYSKAGMMTFPAANAIYRRETYDNYPAARAIMQVVYEGLLGAVRSRSAHRAALVRQNRALAGSGGDDPLPVRLHAGTQQGRAPAGSGAAVAHQAGRHHRRRLHGRERRLRDGAGRHRRRADRSGSGERRQGQSGIQKN